MSNDQSSPQRGRPHYHRGRRGGDRRGTDRRTPQHAPEPGGSRDHTDVEQIMRDIRARIARRHGIDLAPPQIQELAARRLEAILEPRNIRPALLEQMRRAAGAAPVDVPPPAAATPHAPLDEAALYQSHRPLLQTLRRWLNPVLKLFFNPVPLVEAVNAQAAHAAAGAAREAELERQQIEWNALHYEIVQQLVLEVSRATIEVQQLSLRVESLAAKVDFNERRVRGLEGAQSARPASRAPDAPRADTPRPDAPREALPGGFDPPAAAAATAGESGEGSRRRRRRRRGRRSGAGPFGEAAAGAPGTSAGAELDLEADIDEPAEPGDPLSAGDDLTTVPAAASGRAEAIDNAGDTSTALEPAHAFSLLQPVERHPSAESPATMPPAASGPVDAAPADVPPRDEPAPPAPAPDPGDGPDGR